MSLTQARAAVLVQRRWKGALSARAVPGHAGARSCPDRHRQAAEPSRPGWGHLTPAPGRVPGHLEDSLQPL